jgi:hypothetical protein
MLTFAALLKVNIGGSAVMAGSLFLYMLPLDIRLRLSNIKI